MSMHVPSKMESVPRINSTLVDAIPMAKRSTTIILGGPSKIYHFVHARTGRIRAIL